MIARSILAIVAIASTMGVAALGAQPAASPPAATATSLPAGPGRETMLRVCSGCHETEIISRQRLTADGWHKLVELMANNGAQGTDAELEQITAYLAKNFPATPGQ